MLINLHWKINKLTITICIVNTSILWPETVAIIAVSLYYENSIFVIYASVNRWLSKHCRLLSLTRKVKSNWARWDLCRTPELRSKSRKMYWSYQNHFLESFSTKQKRFVVVDFKETKSCCLLIIMLLQYKLNSWTTIAI